MKRVRHLGFKKKKTINEKVMNIFYHWLKIDSYLEILFIIVQTEEKKAKVLQ